MSTSTITKKALALAAAVGMSLGLSPLTVATASAATVNKTIKSSCRTNGAPMNFNQTRGKTDTMTVTAPDSVKAGQEYEVRVDYKPEMIPGPSLPPASRARVLASSAPRRSPSLVVRPS